ncbi:MAG: ribonuclease HII [Gemmatimonadetes bacterium]|jgi:ribonuclease HII|nr:ribonuclease HII [Gemmatimonadota bacterium]MBP6667860.1 ribonuclease HII [Gemmatimonadales bacterium]MBK6780110.1 ribonuclease HII [Gemmatimonadota bacterium]MBK7350850.1 ribonuclease HII [Gemmatimonadota bacterium]MBK7922376.1 ribonuclease HII [Gemmatimonadota bacterium]
MPPRAPTLPSLAREEAAWAGRALLVGVDEVGRGPLAGPVVAAAIAFPPWATPVRGVRDSKTLSARQRAALAPDLRRSALVLALAAASVREIDRLNIRRATALAMHRAVARAVRAASFRGGALEAGVTGYQVLIDGLPLPEAGFAHEALVDGDALCYTIAAAGILAKEVRDGLMRRLALRHPGFGWETNAGYGTAQHCAAIARHGPTVHHRRSFAPVSQFTFDV